MHKLAMAVGFAAGYVLGARAGRQRYEQIAQAARRVRDHPAVQSAAGVVGAQATDLVTRARAKALGALHLGHPREDGLGDAARTAASYPAGSTANGSLR